jgi:hypothetical protein
MTEPKPSYTATLPNQNLIGKSFRWRHLTAKVLAVAAHGQTVLFRFYLYGRPLPNYAAVPLAYLDIDTGNIHNHAPMIVFHRKEQRHV